MRIHRRFSQPGRYHALDREVIRVGLQLDRAQTWQMVAAAVKAPSSHNTQPWRFRIDGSRVLVMADRSRQLPVNDPADRELTISCGAAAFTLVVAAWHAGLDPSVEWLLADSNPDLLCGFEIREGPSAQPDVDELYRAIDRRHTSRGGFTDEPVPDHLVEAMIAAADDRGVWLEILDQASRDPVAGLVAEGDRTQFSDPDWRRELASWMRSRTRGDGLAVPGLLAPVIRAGVAGLDLGPRTARADHALAMNAPVLAVLGTDDDGPDGWFRAGEALQHVLLMAAAEGIQAGFLNQPCQLSELRPRLQEVLGRPGKPQLVLRLGRPTKAISATARRPVDDVMESQ